MDIDIDDLEKSGREQLRGRHISMDFEQGSKNTEALKQHDRCDMSVQDKSDPIATAHIVANMAQHEVCTTPLISWVL